MNLYNLIKSYLRLVYYFFIKFFRIFTNQFFGRNDHKFLFLLCGPFCGSTLLNQLLSTSVHLSCNNNLGNREGLLLPEVRDIMLSNKWDVGVKYPWQKIKNVWMKYWDQRKKILMDKSPPNIIRAKEITKTFNNLFFLAMVRNPYAHAESIIRRNNATPEYAAKFVIKCLKHQRNNKENLKNILFISYEDLCDKTNDSVKKILEFLPDLGMISVGTMFSAHNFKTTSKMRIRNLNNEKISNLSTNNIKVINSFFRKEEDLISYFGYSILEV